MTKPILLTDEQMREFIVNGYVVLNPGVPDEIHATIFEKLTGMLDQGPNPGNNVLPAVPEMRHVLNSPEVRGALISVLGEDYIEHPHRYCHRVAPTIERPRGIRAKLAKNCHQDSYTPIGHSRQHLTRYARIMYYPQDTPVELGPTHVIPGTQYHSALTKEDRKRAIPVFGRAGTVSITHFDVGHAAGVSLLNQPRHMIKFVYMRLSEPTAPSWDCRSRKWRRPRNVEAPYDLNVAWAHVWDWMAGKRDRYESLGNGRRCASADAISRLIEELPRNRRLPVRLEAIRKLAWERSGAAAAVPALLKVLNVDHQAVRIAATYALGAIGESVVGPLVDRLEESGRLEDAHAVPRPWDERATSMQDEAHALGAIGAPAVRALTELLECEFEWTRINAAFALGEMDSAAVDGVPALTRCLKDESHCLVRTVLDSLGAIRQRVSVSEIGRLLENGRAEWAAPLLRGWSARDQVRTNAAMACARLGEDAAPAEAALTRALDDPCGHVGAFAAYALEGIGTPTAAASVRDYLFAQRWDASLKGPHMF